MVYGAKLRTIGTEGHTLKSEKITIIPLCSAASLSIMEEASESHDIRRFMQVVLGGFEPPQTEPKPVVLPLHHRTIWVQNYYFLLQQPNFSAFFL